MVDDDANFVACIENTRCGNLATLNCWGICTRFAMLARDALASLASLVSLVALPMRMNCATRISGEWANSQTAFKHTDKFTACCPTYCPTCSRRPCLDSARLHARASTNQPLVKYSSSASCYSCVFVSRLVITKSLHM